MASLLPPGAWDSHIHVIEPDLFPLSPARPYTPLPASRASARSHLSSLGLSRAVIVQPSVYGPDASALISALKSFEGSAVGVAVVNLDTITSGELDTMDRAGVKGLRVNQRSFQRRFDHAFDKSRVSHVAFSKRVGSKAGAEAALDRENLINTVKRTASIARQRNWAIDLFVDVSAFVALRDLIPDLGVKVVVDHFCGIEMQPDTSDLSDPLSIPGFIEALSLVRSGHLYVKLSAPYRVHSSPSSGFVSTVARLILDAGPDMVVWGSNWPHTGSSEANEAGEGGRLVSQPYRDINDQESLAEVLKWFKAGKSAAKADEAVRRTFVENPSKLWVCAQSAEL